MEESEADALPAYGELVRRVISLERSRFIFIAGLLTAFGYQLLRILDKAMDLP